MNINLNDKVIVITGSSRGLGKEMIKVLAKEGAGVVINYKSNDNLALELFEDIKKINNKCIMVKADVSEIADVKMLYQKTISRFRKIDVLINNAGTCDDNYIQFMGYKQWEKVIKTNLYSVFLCSRIFSKNMIKNKQGKIINIASIKGQLGSEGQCNYSASKAGIIGITKSLAKELGRANISVNAICPGFVVTDMNRGNNIKVDYANRMSILDNKHTIKDLLSFITLMSSDYIKGISGQVFNLDSRIM